MRYVITVPFGGDTPLVLRDFRLEIWRKKTALLYSSSTAKSFTTDVNASKLLRCVRTDAPRVPLERSCRVEHYRAKYQRFTMKIR